MVMIKILAISQKRKMSIKKGVNKTISWRIIH